MRAAGSVLHGGSWTLPELEYGGGRMLFGRGRGRPIMPDGSPDYFSELGEMRTNRTNAATGRLNEFSQGLTDDAATFETTQGNLISGLEKRLGGVNSDFEMKSAAEILEDERARKRLRSSFAKASRLGADMAIADGTRSAKAMFAHRGGGGSSYANRLAIGLRMRSEADAAGRMSDLERDDHANIADSRSRLRSTLFGANRNDIGTVFGERSRLSGNMFDVRRGNAANVYGERSRIDGSDASQERADLFATRNIRPINAPLPESGAGFSRFPVNNVLTYRSPGRRVSRLSF